MSTLVTSNEITVAGINAVTSISVSNGKYSLNSGAFLATEGTVKNGDKVKVQHTSSASPATKVDTVLTIGGVADTFSSTTKANPSTNVPPIANAGPDQVVNAGTKVTLSGSGTDANGDTLSYQWTQSNGTTIMLIGDNTATTSFTAPNITVDTTLSFTLTVSDGKGGTATDSVVVVVKKAGAKTGITNLATGNNHTCAVLNGGVQCWGHNKYGQLGNGTTIDSHVPVQAIAAGSGVTVVAAGGYHSCAVVNGGVKCWGYNATGQIGDGKTIDRLRPVQTIAVGSDVKAIATGEGHTCALINDGVKCWGYNGEGALGDGTSDTRLAPVQTMAAGSGVTSITAGGSHSCAVVSGGVKCWGYNSYGALGDGTTTTWRLTPIQTIPTGSGVTTVAAGSGHTCALINGGVKCWGYNGEGELGDGTTINRLTPVQTIGAGSGVTAITAGGSHSCAVVNNGVKCWGYNYHGQLGNGDDNDQLIPVQAIPAGSGVTSVTGGGNYYTCALVAGQVKCWGANDYGQFGNGTTDHSYTPVDGPSFSTN